MNIIGHHIAIGSEDGRMKLYTSHWDPVFEIRIVAVRLTKLTFVGCKLVLCYTVIRGKKLHQIKFNLQYNRFVVIVI